MLKNNKFILTGGNGFLGRHVFKKLINLGVSKNNILVPNSKQYDLRLKNNVEKLLFKDAILIHLAAKLDGLSANINKQADFFYDNSIMALNLLKVGNDVGIKKFVGIGSTLEYPEAVHAPISEDKLWSGFPSKLTAPYGLAKKVMLLGSQYFRDQYELNSIHLLITNLYGPGDNFKSETARVIPSIILKIHNAKKSGKNYINVWGDGSSSRDLLFVKDAAEAIVLATQYYNKKKPINIGSGRQTTIRQLVEKISFLMNFEGTIHWDTHKQVEKKSNHFDIRMARKEIKYVPNTDLLTGLKQTINFFKLNNKHINNLNSM